MNEMATNIDPGVPLYCHRRRSEWGLAILAWEQATKRGYQFQDGVLRIINEEFYGLMTTVIGRPQGADELVAELTKKAGLRARTAPLTRTRKGGGSFTDQVRMFQRAYPGGFSDSGWLELIRGVGSDRRLKRHRQPAMAELGGLLDSASLSQARSEGRGTAVVDAIIAALSGTNLVKPKELDVLRRLGTAEHDRYLGALHRLLYDESSLEQRFDRFAAVYGGRGSWPLVTAPAALARAEALICIQPAVFRRQAGVLGRTLSIENPPRGRVYQRLLTLTGYVRDLLTEASLTPADLMDVYDFMGTTLLPSARNLLKE